ncbi:ribose-phosphate pyrophosphokinase [Lachnotalea glycerini]|jgi:ribose-phosphate pyrophosphokinase|uniref:ribose-phosphate diphosphokinase n=1 Tax=Lachnotalea glycerini TaxID=1763509 RepID=A0A255IJD9_9FIRM|nr:ribose-phosphate pyrophosphokinase [Lachnotalea glycerini]PXV95557.1 ribose-phosphate pyrophosphokinase [Lachnotalea glycerini]RDY32873.1 ribose-phosphate pyrophosphokinase [Lachnotalea glycerini]
MISINDQTIELGNYPDGTLLMKFAMTGNSFEIQWIYESDAELFALICTANHLRRLNPNAEISLLLPYLPHARMDRVKQDTDVFTLKYFVDIINSLNFSKVSVLDVHSSVSEYAVNRIKVLSPKSYIHETIKKIKQSGIQADSIFYVDEGGQKRYSDMVQLPSVYGHKKRDWETGTILGVEIIGDKADVRDKNLLIIDDIIAYGGSIYYSAKRLKEMGCKNLYVYASHIENSILDEEKGMLIRSGLIEKFFTTKTIFTKEHQLIEIL